MIINRVAPQNHCELHRVILRIKEEIVANEEKTSSSSAASSPSHSPFAPSSTYFSSSLENEKCESKVATINEKCPKFRIYSNSINSEDMDSKQSSKERTSSNFRNEAENEICKMITSCDISSSTSGVDTSTAGSSSCSDNNGGDGKTKAGDRTTDMFDEHSTSLVI